MFEYLRSWFQMNYNDDDENENERQEEEQDDQEKEETKKTFKYREREQEREQVPDTDLMKDRKKYRSKPQPNLSKIKKVKKSLRFATSLTTKTKKRRSYLQ